MNMATTTTIATASNSSSSSSSDTTNISGGGCPTMGPLQEPKSWTHSVWTSVTSPFIKRGKRTKTRSTTPTPASTPEREQEQLDPCRKQQKQSHWHEEHPIFTAINPQASSPSNEGTASKFAVALSSSNSCPNPMHPPPAEAEVEIVVIDLTMVNSNEVHQSEDATLPNPSTSTATPTIRTSRSAFESEAPASHQQQHSPTNSNSNDKTRRSSRRSFPTKRMLNSIAQQQPSYFCEEEEAEWVEKSFPSSTNKGNTRKTPTARTDTTTTRRQIKPTTTTVTEPSRRTTTTTNDGAKNTDNHSTRHARKRARSSSPPLTATTSPCHGNVVVDIPPLNIVIDKLQCLSLRNTHDSNGEDRTNHDSIIVKVLHDDDLTNQDTMTVTMWSKDSWEDASAWIDMPIDIMGGSSVGSPPKKRGRSKSQPLQQLLQHNPEVHESDERVLASLVMISNPAYMTPQLEIFNRMQSQTPLFRFAGSVATTTIPSTTSASSNNAPLPNSTATEKACAFCHVTLRCVRIRVAAGMVRCAVVCLHDLLTEAYGEASQFVGTSSKATTALQPSSNIKGDLLLEENEERMQQLFAIRERIAGLWCIYAHVLMELGDLSILQQQRQQDRKQQHNHSLPNRQQENKKYNDSPPDRRCRRPRKGEERKTNSAADHSSTATVTQIIDHVMAVLRAARSCPLVGNHSWIVLALGRFIMSGLALKHLPPPPSRQQQIFLASEGEDDATTVATMDHDNVQDTISLAIETCWDAMDDSCHGTCNAHVAVRTGDIASKRPQRRVTTLQQQHRQRQLVQSSTMSDDDDEDTIVGEPEAVAYCIDGLHTFGPRLGKEPRLSLEELENSLCKILELPKELEHSIMKPKKKKKKTTTTTTTTTQQTNQGHKTRTTKRTPFIFMDRNAIRDLSLELNQWSRLGESLETQKQQQQRTTQMLQPRQSVSTSPTTTNLLDDLPLFQFAQLIDPSTEPKNQKLLPPTPSSLQKQPYSRLTSVCQDIAYACLFCYACFPSQTKLEQHEQGCEGCHGTFGSTLQETDCHAPSDTPYSYVLWTWQ